MSIKSKASALKRAASMTPEQKAERVQKMNDARAANKVSPEDLKLLAWMRENRTALEGLIANWQLFASQPELSGLSSSTFLLEPISYNGSPLPPADSELLELRPKLYDLKIVPGPQIDRHGFKEIDNGLVECTECRSTYSEMPANGCPACATAHTPTIQELDESTAKANEQFPKPFSFTEPEQNAAATCSICFSPIENLDEPCETCVKAGRLSPNGSPIDLHGAQQRFTPSQAPAAPAVPTLSNALTLQPKKAPQAPPLRRYSPSETCNECGRLPELHSSVDPANGPISSHPFRPQPIVP